MPWTADSLTSHLSSQHQISPDQYRQDHMPGYRFNQAATSHMMDVTNWADKNRLYVGLSMVCCTVVCRWECGVAGCGETLHSRVKLVLHVRRAHDLTALNYFREHKESLASGVQHACQLCAASILWDSYYLREHLRIKHKMKLLTYKNKVVNNYEENITGESHKMVLFHQIRLQLFSTLFCQRMKPS